MVVVALGSGLGALAAQPLGDRLQIGAGLGLSGAAQEVVDPAGGLRACPVAPAVVERRRLGVVVVVVQSFRGCGRVEPGVLLDAAGRVFGDGRGGVGDLVPVAVGDDARDVAAPRDALERVARRGPERARPCGAMGLDVVDQGLDAGVDEAGVLACPAVTSATGPDGADVGGRAVIQVGSSGARGSTTRGASPTR
ncbi:hypothetical protein [Cellulosimicrobium cellulans]|uniref:hypothetical protein n=1 Tax=Cellulosimicrobium cellulans TaxID=1710 RepID=UPI001BADC5EF|nr:hypothetical protein [Cellulosimicrobium cellulans]QUC00414.1 hypothetical protein J5A69_03935 [Cellulosimicrobium cellulans]